MAKMKLEIGPVGLRAAANITALRADRGLNQAELGARMTDIGRPMTGAVVSKTEKLDRRLDVDDLVAFAVALGTTPNRLLLAGFADDPGEIDLAPEAARVHVHKAWEWATGELPLSLPAHLTTRWSRPDEHTMLKEEELLKFIKENSPHTSEGESNISAAMEKLDNHPDVLKQALVLVQIADREGVGDFDFLIATIDLASFMVRNKFSAQQETGGGDDGQG